VISADFIIELPESHAYDAIMNVDMAHTVSINGIFTSIQYNSEINQVSAVLMYFSQLFKSSALNNKNLDFGTKLL
jgi:hypothetical protein